MADWPGPTSSATLEMELIATTTLGAPAVSISFTGINTAFRVFELAGYLLGDANAEGIVIQFNNDTSTNYDYEYVNGSGATITTNRIPGAAGWAATAGALAANAVGEFYASFSKPAAAEKASGVAQAGYLAFGSNAEEAWMTGGNWSNVAALISRVDVVGNTAYIAGSRVTLGGAKAA